MKGTYRELAERADDRVPKAQEGEQTSRRRRVVGPWLLLPAFVMLDVLLTFLNSGTKGLLYELGMFAVLAVLAVAYFRVQVRRERRSSFRQKLARETEEFLCAVEDKKMKTRVFLPPIVIREERAGGRFSDAAEGSATTVSVDPSEPEVTASSGQTPRASAIE